MAHRTLVGGTAYQIKGGKTLVGGTAYSISKGKTLIGGAAYEIAFVNYNPTFASNDWAAIIAACQNNEVPSTWAVGDSKVMAIGGVNYNVDIIGKNHDTYTGGGTAPLTFQLHELYPSTTPGIRMNNTTTNTPGWSNCAMRTTSMPTIMSAMPSEVQAGLRAVNKVTSAGNNSSSLSTTSDKLFLLSEVEVFGSCDYSFSGEGSQYKYYSNGGEKGKKFPGSSGGGSTQHLRSPAKDFTTHYCVVYNDGSSGYSISGSSAFAAPAFCF